MGSNVNLSINKSDGVNSVVIHLVAVLKPFGYSVETVCETRSTLFK